MLGTFPLSGQVLMVLSVLGVGKKRCLVNQIRRCYQVFLSQLMVREKVSFYVLLSPFSSLNVTFLVFLNLFCIPVFQYFPWGVF